MASPEEAEKRIVIWNKSPSIQRNIDLFEFLRAEVEYSLQDDRQKGLQEYITVRTGHWRSRYRFIVGD